MVKKSMDLAIRVTEVRCPSLRILPRQMITFLRTTFALSALMSGLAISVPSALAQLAVVVSAPKVAGSKAVVTLALKNHFAEKVESARAAVFLSDEQGKMVANGSKWVIGGSRGSTALAPNTERNYEFVLQAGKPFASTNLTVRISFTRLVLDGGRVADPSKNVTVNPEKAAKNGD
jgi:hypothetical protein